MTEKQLTKARENTALLMKKLSEAEEEIEFLNFQMEKERKEKEERIAEVEELRYQMIRIEKEGYVSKEGQTKTGFEG